MIDSHAHLSLCADGGLALSPFLRSWADAGGGLVMDIGIRPGDLSARAELLRASGGGAIPPFLRFSAGAWPYGDLLERPESTALALESAIEAVAAKEPDVRVAAIGECGLDYHHMNAPRERQIELLMACADLAKRRSLPLTVHSRDAFQDTLAAVKASGWGERTIIHCYSYGSDEAKAFLDAGASISFSGSLTFKSAEDLRLAAALVPRDRLLAETDAPYMTPGKDRGKRASTPMDVKTVVSLLAELKSVSPEEIEADIDRNAALLFGKR